ncbi:MAG: hypothetical protein CMP47_00660 [Rickettsiales bacterium]|jgi:hypothetical protein|nr:hypothetical protein [Rickettsiales bacterium]
MKTLALFLVVINLVSCSSENTYPDYKNKIIGKWRINNPGVPYYYGEAEYKENGEMIGWSKAIYPDGAIEEILFHDSWRIEGNKIFFLL